MTIDNKTTINGAESQPETIVSAVICYNCMQVIYARTSTDLRFCRCKDVWVDGGPENPRHGTTAKAKCDIIKLVIPYSKKQLYDDWNWMEDKLGVL